MSVYKWGWPVWPFTKLTEAEMAMLLKAMEAKKIEATEDALV